MIIPVIGLFCNTKKKFCPRNSSSMTLRTMFMSVIADNCYWLLFIYALMMSDFIVVGILHLLFIIKHLLYLQSSRPRTQILYSTNFRRKRYNLNIKVLFIAYKWKMYIYWFVFTVCYWIKITKLKGIVKKPKWVK